MDRLDTELKLLPTILRLIVGLIGVGGLLFLSRIVGSLISEPSTPLLMATIMYSTLTFLFCWTGIIFNKNIPT